jgi:hypothetical protein
LESNEPLDFDEFLLSPSLAASRNEVKLRAILFHVFGSVSFIASSALAFHILRSHDCLSTTYHRLVMGLSIADMMSSFAIALSTVMVPKEMNYFIPFARGNAASCYAQGFLIMVGYFTATMYNCCICCYYLSIIKYNKKDDYIKNKLEPWFHGVAVIFPIIDGIVILGLKGMNPDSNGAPVCFHAFNNPPHCIGREDGFLVDNFTIPCGRGNGMGMKAFKKLNDVTPCLIGIVTIASTMISMYRTVLENEKKIQKYDSSRGISRASIQPRNVQHPSIRPAGPKQSSFSKLRSSLRPSEKLSFGLDPSEVRPPVLSNPSVVNLQNSIIRDTNNTTLEQVNEGRTVEGAIDKNNYVCNSLMVCLPCFRRRREKNVAWARRRSNNMERHKRSILHMAFAYSITWVLIWIPFIMYAFFRSHPVEILFGILTPLQGVYNLSVFLFPRARDIKDRSKNKSIGWLQAFAKAFMARGSKTKNFSASTLSSKNSRSILLRSFRDKYSNSTSSLRQLLFGKLSLSGKFAPGRSATIAKHTDLPQVIDLNHGDLQVDIEQQFEEQPEVTETSSQNKTTSEEQLDVAEVSSSQNKRQGGGQQFEEQLDVADVSSSQNKTQEGGQQFEEQLDVAKVSSSQIKKQEGKQQFKEQPDVAEVSSSQNKTQAGILKVLAESTTTIDCHPEEWGANKSEEGVDDEKNSNENVGATFDGRRTLVTFTIPSGMDDED